MATHDEFARMTSDYNALQKALKKKEDDIRKVMGNFHVSSYQRLQVRLLENIIRQQEQLILQYKKRLDVIRNIILELKESQDDNGACQSVCSACGRQRKEVVTTTEKEKD